MSYTPDRPLEMEGRGGEGGREGEGRRWTGEGKEVEGPVGDTAGDTEMERTGVAKREKLER